MFAPLGPVIAGCGLRMWLSLWLGVLFSFLGHRFLLLCQPNCFHVGEFPWRQISWARRACQELPGLVSWARAGV